MSDFKYEHFYCFQNSFRLFQLCRAQSAKFSSADALNEIYTDLSEPEVNLEGLSHKTDDNLFEIVSREKDIDQLISFYNMK